MTLFDRDRLVDKKPIRSKLSDEDEYEQDESGADLTQLDIGGTNGKSKSEKNIHEMVENWKESIQSDEAQRKMLENYIRAYVDVTDDELDEILSQHGF